MGLRPKKKEEEPKEVKPKEKPVFEEPKVEEKSKEEPKVEAPKEPEYSGPVRPCTRGGCVEEMRLKEKNKNGDIFVCKCGAETTVMRD